MNPAYPQEPDASLAPTRRPKDPRLVALEKDADKARDEIMAKTKDGKVTSINDVSEEFIIGGLVRAAIDTRRPTVQLAALNKLAEMKGLTKAGSGSGNAADALEDMLSQFEERSKKRPRSTKDAAERRAQ